MDPSQSNAQSTNLSTTWADMLPVLLIGVSNRGTIEYVNTATLETTGFSPQELINQDLAILLSDKWPQFSSMDDLAQWFNKLETTPCLSIKTQRGIEVSLEWTWTKSSQVNAIAHTGSDENVSISRDVQWLLMGNSPRIIPTITPTSTAPLHHEISRLFIRHAPAAIAMLDKDMNYILTSQRWLSDYSLDDKDIIGKCHYEVFPEIPQRWKDLHQRTLNGEALRSDEDHFVRTDGTLEWLRWENIPWYDEDGKVGGVIMFTEVLTGIKNLAAEHQKVLSLTSDLICIFDFDGLFTYANPAFENQLGYPVTKLIGSDIHQYVHLDDATTLESLTAQLFAGKPVQHATFRFAKANGDTVWLSWNMEIDPGSRKVYAVARDITKQQEVMQALQETRKRAEWSSHSKGLLIDTLCRDTKHPLDILQQQLSTLERSPLSREQQASLKLILSSTQQIQSVLSGVSDYSDIQTVQQDLKEEVCSVGSLLDDAVRTLVDELQKPDVELMADYDPRTPLTVKTDPQILLRTFSKMVNHCASMISNKGLVRLSAQEVVTNDIPRLQIEVGCSSGSSPATSNEGEANAGFCTLDNMDMDLVVAKELAFILGSILTVQRQIQGSFKYTLCLDMVPHHPDHEKNPTAQEKAKADLADEMLKDRVLLIAPDTIHHQHIYNSLIIWGAEVEWVQAKETSEDRLQDLFHKDHLLAQSASDSSEQAPAPDVMIVDINLGATLFSNPQAPSPVLWAEALEATSPRLWLDTHPLKSKSLGEVKLKPEFMATIEGDVLTLPTSPGTLFFWMKHHRLPTAPQVTKRASSSATQKNDQQGIAADPHGVSHVEATLPGTEAELAAPGTGSTSINIPALSEPPRILVVAQNSSNQLFLYSLLKGHGFSPITVSQGKEILNSLNSRAPHMVVLDCDVNKEKSEKIIQIIRRWHQLQVDSGKKIHEIYIIGLVNVVHHHDHIEAIIPDGLDDYLNKPLDNDALIELVVHYTIPEEQRSQGKQDNDSLAPVPTPLPDSEDSIHVDVLQNLSQLKKTSVQDIMLNFLSQVDTLLSHSRSALADGDLMALSLYARQIELIAIEYEAKALEREATQLVLQATEAKFSASQESLAKVHQHFNQTKVYLKSLSLSTNKISSSSAEKA